MPNRPPPIAVVPAPKPSPAETPGPLLSPDQVAARLGVSRSMAYKLIRLRELRALRVGRLPRVPSAEVDSYVARQLAKAMEWADRHRQEAR